MIRLITLDVNNTLLRFRWSPGEEYCRVAAAYGVAADATAINSALRVAIGEQSRASPVFGRGSDGWESWWRKVVSVTFEQSGATLTEQQEKGISEQLLHWYSTGPSYTVLPHTHQLLDALASKEIIVGVLTNTDPRIKQVLDDHGFSKYFKFVLDAYTLGFLKPNSKVFESALAASGIEDLQPSEALHIGDNARKDYLGASEAGWQSWLVAPDAQRQCADIGLAHEQGTLFEDLKQMLPALKNI